ncbi:MAG: DUF5110 domain-containing protein [Bdellovibrionales bacterium]|nr:DUF5110 domain-containing protein [Bdellovibrionales bacterium]
MIFKLAREVLATVFLLLPICVAQGSPETLLFNFYRSNQYVQVEIWQEDLFHFRFGSSKNPGSPIWTTPSVLSERRNPSQAFLRRSNAQGEQVIETTEFMITVSNDLPCINVEDKKNHQKPLTNLCVAKNAGSGMQLKIDQLGMKQVFGLGQQLDDPRKDGGLGDDWVGRKRVSPGPYGNFMKEFIGGAVGDTQIPVLYAMGDGYLGYGMYFDSLAKLSFDFQSQPWSASTDSEDLSGFFFTGPNLKDWRSDYIALTGRPPVPPRKMFGLWVSEYGYDNWQELESKLQSLKAKNFPVDGFVMDLQWFGGVQSHSDHTPMGRLQWDENRFPQPAKKIAELDKNEHLGLILIEESYVGKGLQEHQELASRGLLAKDCFNCGPSYNDTNPWWGKGGMIDWTNPAARNYWAESKRKALVDMGVQGHWTDLGEPEMFQPWSWYSGWPELGLHNHASIHNYFSFSWHQGIVEGYSKFHPERRPFILSRSGGPGSPRFGVAMWSADIGSNMPSLASHLRAQMHMSLSGFDFYGSDIGGFHRGGLDGDLNLLYTQWFANSSLLDIPVRPHVENTCNCKETAPDRLGHEESNRANIKLRYQLAPYYYSLAHAAHENGEAIFPPVFYHFQDDPLARGMAHQKMIGPNLMMGITASYVETVRKIYLPKGTWYEFYENSPIVSRGEWVSAHPFWKTGKFQLPLYVREGAVLPLMGETVRHLEKSSGGAEELRIYPSKNGGEFVLREDDGETTAYMAGAIKRTKVSHQSVGSDYVVRIGSSEGTYAGASNGREWKVQVISHRPVSSISWNGNLLAKSNQKIPGGFGSWVQPVGKGPITVYIPRTDDQILKELKVSYAE